MYTAILHHALMYLLLILSLPRIKNALIRGQLLHESSVGLDTTALLFDVLVGSV